MPSGSTTWNSSVGLVRRMGVEGRRIRALDGVRARRSIVLGYHGVAETRRRDDLHLLQIAPDRFRAQIKLLHQAGFRFVTMAQLARLADGAPPPPGYAAVTFDDGMANNHEIALPILREYDIPATVYVTTGLVGATSPWIGRGGSGAMMTAHQLRELVDTGWELGGHTRTHPDLSTLDYAACRAEIADGCAELERIAGTRVETFAYPLGRYGPAALAAVRDCGLLAGVTAGSGVWNRYEITRAMIGAIDPFLVVLLKLTDRYEPLLRMPPLNVLRHASKRARVRLGEQRSGRP